MVEHTSDVRPVVMESIGMVTLLTVPAGLTILPAKGIQIVE